MIKRSLMLGALLALGVSSSLAQTTVYPTAVTDLIARPVPSITVPAGLNSTFVDPSFGRVIRRITNGTTGNASNQNASHRMPSSEQVAAFGRNSDRFYAETPYGTIEYFKLDVATGNATYLRDLPFTSEPTFSRVQPSVIYGPVGYRVIAYDTDTNVSTTLLDLTKSDPAYAVAPLVLGGSVQSSAGSVERIIAFYGGASQDKHFRAVVFDAANPANASVLDTVAKTLNGVPIAMDSFHIHAIGMDQSGRYAIIYPTGPDQSAGAAPMYAWDVSAGVVTANRTMPWGHDSAGYGVYVNNAGDIGSPYDAYEFAVRNLNDLSHYTKVISPQLTPQMVNMDTHPNWANARPDVLTPLVVGTYRFYENIAQNLDTDPTHRTNTVAWRAGDNEIDSFMPVAGGTIYRWAHHFSNIYSDDGSGAGIGFWYEPIPQVSPDGRWILFHSNMQKSLGLDAVEKSAAFKYRSDLFLIDTQQPLVTSTAPSSTAPTVIVSPTTLVSNQAFTVTVTGDCTDVTGVELFKNGTSQGVKACDPTGTLFPFPSGLSASTYTFTATATGPAGTSDPSNPVQQTIAARKPGKRGVKVTGGGL